MDEKLVYGVIGEYGSWMIGNLDRDEMSLITDDLAVAEKGFEECVKEGICSVILIQLLEAHWPVLALMMLAANESDSDELHYAFYQALKKCSFCRILREFNNY